MPQIFKIGGYWVYFWTDESKPLEPVHVHVDEGKPTQNGTKIWITQSGKCLIAHNKSNIPKHKLNQIVRVVESMNITIVKKWIEYFGEIQYYC